MAKRGSLSYFPGYSRGAVGREIRRLVATRGYIGGATSLGAQAWRNATAYFCYSLFQPRIQIRGSWVLYYAGLQPFRVKRSPIPAILRLANVFSKIDSERAIEIPLALDFARHAKEGELLEIGNVLGYYAAVAPHTVVDRYETIPGVVNEDALSFHPGRRYEAIVSVSTIEHIGFDEPELDPQKPIRVVRRLIELLKEGGQMLLTVPFGYNPSIDNCVRMGGFADFELTAISCEPGSLIWKEVKLDQDKLPGRTVLILTYPKSLGLIPTRTRDE